MDCPASHHRAQRRFTSVRIGGHASARRLRRRKGGFAERLPLDCTVLSTITRSKSAGLTALMSTAQSMVALSNWTALTNFVDDGRIDAHNNTAERALRGVAIGRKNYLHVGSDAG